MAGFRTILDPGEETIARARVSARQLGARLATTLIDRGLYRELQRFLDELGFRACDALDVLAERPEDELRDRLHLLLGIGLQAEKDEQ